MLLLFIIILLFCRLTYNASAYITTCYSATGRKYNAGACISLSYLLCYQAIDINHSSGAVRESRWPSWTVHPNEPSGFRGHKELLNHAHGLVSACP